MGGKRTGFQSAGKQYNTCGPGGTRWNVDGGAVSYRSRINAVQNRFCQNLVKDLDLERCLENLKMNATSHGQQIKDPVQVMYGLTSNILWKKLTKNLI